LRSTRALGIPEMKVNFHEANAMSVKNIAAAIIAPSMTGPQWI
jgi:hypothetical protein